MKQGPNSNGRFCNILRLPCRTAVRPFSALYVGLALNTLRVTCRR